jgi:hypothetical protein
MELLCKYVVNGLDDDFCLAVKKVVEEEVSQNEYTWTPRPAAFFGTNGIIEGI